MAEKYQSEMNEEQIISYLRDVTDKIRTELDPIELNQYRRLFRKGIPFTLRSYFAAFVLKQLNEGKMPAKVPGQYAQGVRSNRTSKKDSVVSTKAKDQSLEKGKKQKKEVSNRGSKNTEIRSTENSRFEARTAERTQAEPRPVLADDISTTLFISIGRNRRVYPRDLIGLMMQNIDIQREHIGDIRVLDNYSFVQVLTEDAQKVIEALNEFEYRGRKLAVSFSRKRDEAVTNEDLEEDIDSSSDSFSRGYSDTAFGSTEDEYSPEDQDTI